MAWKRASSERPRCSLLKEGLWPPARSNGARKNYGFITFRSEDALRAALAAGVEQAINGKTVRLNVAGPRPEQRMEPARHRGGATSSASPAPSGGPQGWPVGASLDPWPTAPAPQLWQQGGVPDLTSGIPGPDLRHGVVPGLRNARSGGLDSHYGGGSGGGEQDPAAVKGKGPRIYVGGIPTAVSETMVRGHFNQWGQVVDVYFPKDRATNRRKNFCFVTFATQQAAEAAAAQSNREISGYRIESISITDERQRHYQNKQGMGYQGPGQLGEGAYAAGGGGAGAALYNDAGSSGLVAGQQYMMPDGSTAPGVAGHPQMGGMGQLNTGSGNLQWQMGLGGVSMGGQGGMPYAPLAGSLGEVSLGMPGNVAYLQQYGAGMPAGAMGALGTGSQGGGWHRGGGTPAMAWPYRGGGGDAGSAAAAQSVQNLNYQQMLMNASLYQQSQGAAGGGGSGGGGGGGGLVDVSLLPGGAGNFTGGGGGMQAPSAGAADLSSLGRQYPPGSGGAGVNGGAAPRQPEVQERAGLQAGGGGSGATGNAGGAGVGGAQNLQQQ